MNSIPENQKTGTLILRDRKLLELDGVSDVIGFDEMTVLLRTALGSMTVEGKDLHITRLDLEKGVVSVTGHISAVLYTDESKGEKRSFFARMMK